MVSTIVWAGQRLVVSARDKENMVTRNRTATFTFPLSEIRSLPYPDQQVSDDRRAKRLTFFASVDDIPMDLKNWMDVNPRRPILDAQGKLRGQMAARLNDTLVQTPETFVLKNIGIFILAKEAKWEKKEGGHGELEVVLDDPEMHGVVNGGHTLHAILEARASDDYEPGKAFVPVHILVGIHKDYIVALAEGLNRSVQVQDKSLENLSGTFDEIKKVMEGKQGAEQIAYRQGDEGEVDILQVLTYLGCFNLDVYDRRKHPNELFGQSKKLLNDFHDDQENEFAVYGKIIRRLPEILILADKIQQVAYEKCAATLSRRKVSNAKKNNRAASPKYKREAHFAGGMIRGKFFEGWLLPMLAAFRACVSQEEWKKGKFVWLVDPVKVLDVVIEEMVEHVMNTYEDYRDKPAEVGRKPPAYQLCFSAVQMALAQIGKLEPDAPHRTVA
ncbi:MAG: hypothetical protein DYH12_11440 [Sorangiineae bacterium PRO1]|nr:hypothetical protein [Sorangiineae bacterium PRO1]